MGPTFFKMRALYLSLHACMANFPNGALARRPFRGRRPYEQGYGSLLPWGEEKNNGFCDQTLFQDKVVIDDPESIGPFETFQPFEGQPLARFYTCRDTYVFVQSHARTALQWALSRDEWPRNLFSFVVKNLSDTLSWCSLRVCMLIKCNTCRMHCVFIYVYSDT